MKSHTACAAPSAPVASDETPIAVRPGPSPSAAAVPDDRVLVESDVEDFSVARDATCRAVRLVAGAKSWTLVEAAARTAANARAWLDG